MPATVPYGRVTQKPPAVSDLHVLWLTAGLGCDGALAKLTEYKEGPLVEHVELVVSELGIGESRAKSRRKHPAGVARSGSMPACGAEDALAIGKKSATPTT